MTRLNGVLIDNILNCTRGTRNILRKIIAGYLISVDFITFETTISNQSIFVSDRTQQSASKMYAKIRI